MNLLPSALFGMALIFFARPGYALSCIGLNDHFYLKCTAGDCKGEFRAKEIHSAGACGRRTVVESLPDDYVRVLTNRVRQLSEAEHKDGLVQVTLIHRFYGSLPATAEELALSFTKDEFRVPRIQVQKLDESVSISDVKNGWGDKAKKELMSTVLYQLADWGILISALILVLKTTANYRCSLLAHFQKEKVKPSVCKPVVLQAGLFSIAAIFLLSMMDFILVGLVAPLILLLWIFEALMFLAYRLKFLRRVENEL